MNRKKRFIKDSIVTIIILLFSTGISLVFQYALDAREKISDLFIFSIFLIALWTDGYFHGLASAFIGMLVVNYAFTTPFFILNFTIAENIVAAVLMMVIAVLTSALTSKLKIQDAIEAAAEKERTRATLLRAISHDLRTPLTTIYGASSTLLDQHDSLTSEQQNRILHSIREDSEWLIRMVENLLSITRLDGGKVKIIKTPSVLDELIDSVISKFKKRYPSQPVDLDIPDEIVIIAMDALLIEQVLINILDNAVMHAKGMTKLSLKVSVSDNLATFEISDNGCGIPSDRLDRIFSGYHNGDIQSADSQKRNAGIGLSVCDVIIRAHGGKISAENQKSGGAAFRFTLITEDIASDKQ